MINPCLICISMANINFKNLHKNFTFSCLETVMITDDWRVWYIYRCDLTRRKTARLAQALPTSSLGELALLWRKPKGFLLRMWLIEDLWQKTWVRHAYDTVGSRSQCFHMLFLKLKTQRNSVMRFNVEPHGPFQYLCGENPSRFKMNSPTISACILTLLTQNDFVSTVTVMLQPSVIRAEWLAECWQPSTYMSSKLRILSSCMHWKGYMFNTGFPTLQPGHWVYR